MSERYNLPADTAVLVNDSVARCRNLSLILDKYPPARVVEQSKYKGPWLSQLLQENHLDPELAKAVYARWQHLLHARSATSFEATLDWRMVVGLGGESVLETDITLHHLYGLPLIPASSLKGLTRAYLTGEVEGHLSEKIEEDDEDVLRIFGSQKQAGSVLFFDALPSEGKATLALDIMNPHYQEYYSNNRPPTNDQDPVPVTFLTIADTTFTFALAPRNPQDEQHRKDVEEVKAWLLQALQNYGVGGKTSAGYGYFKQAPAGESAKPATSMGSASRPTEHIRPPIPSFHEGQEISGSVIAPSDLLRRLAPSDTQAFLRYQSFDSREVAMVVSAKEAQNWKPGETHHCIFQREETHDGCAVLICQPRAKKVKKK